MAGTDIPSGFGAPPDVLVRNATAAGPPDELRALVDAAADAARRFAERADPAELDREIGLWRQIITSAACADADGAFHAAVSSSASDALRRRFRLLEQAADLQAAVEHAERAVAATVGAGRARRCHDLAVTLSMRHRHSGDPSDLDAAVATFTSAVAAADPDERLLFAPDLARAFRLRYERAGDPADLDGWISAAASAAGPAAPGWPGLPDVLHLLGTGLLERYERDADPRDLDAAINAYDYGSITAARTGSALRPELLVGLGANLTSRFARTHDPADLDRAVHAAEAALVELDRGAPLHAAGLALLGRATHLRYSAAGRASDLDRAITAFGRLVELPGTASVAHFTELARCLSARAQATAELRDLLAAVDAYTRAADVADGPDQRGAVLSGLGAAWTAVYERTGEPQYLSNAVAAQEAASREAASPDPR